MSGLLLLPTLNRPEILKHFIRSYKETNSSIETMVLVDREDKFHYTGLELPENIYLFDTEGNVSMGDKCRYVWKTVKEKAPTWIGLLNDDHYCITQEWDKKAEGLLNGTNF